MALERVPGSSSLVDVLDRILDKGLVIDAWARISLPGIDLREARLAVASMDLDRKLADAADGAAIPRPAPAERRPAEVAHSRRGGRKRGHG